jgi:hypothetical protein
MKQRLTLALAATSLILPWIFFDIDLGDQAYHSLGSWLIAFRPKMPDGHLPFWFEQVPIWFSYFVDSLWWKVIGADASVLATRVGWLLFQVLILVLLREVFARLYPQKSLLLPMLAGLLAVNCSADQFVLSYYVIPPAFGALTFALWAVAIGARSNQMGALLAISAGVMTMATIQARLPSAPFLLIGIIIMWLVPLLTPAQGRRLKPQLLLYFASGFAFGGFICFLALSSSGQLEYIHPGMRAFFDGVTSESNQRYSKAIILQRFVGHYYRIFIGAVIFFSVCLALSLATARYRNTVLLISLTLMGFLAVVKYGIVLAVVIGGSIALAAYSCWRNRHEITSARLALFLGALGCLSIFTLGTYLEGVQNFKYGLWLLVPFALLEFDSIEGDRQGKKVFGGFLLASVAILFLVTRILWPTYPYLERPLFRMTARFQNEAAKGMFSYPEKAASLDSLLSALNELGLKKGDTLFAYAAVPSYYPISGIYLLTRTVPLFHDPGMVEYPGSRWPKNFAAFKAEAAANNLPALIVRQKEAFPRLGPSSGAIAKNVWKFAPEPPISNFRWTNFEDNWLAGEIDQVLAKAGYTPIWQDSYFLILAAPSLKK